MGAPTVARRAVAADPRPRGSRSPASGGGQLVLIRSRDLDASVSAVTEAGGAVVEGPCAFPRRFHVTDPSGNELGVDQEG